MDQRGGDRNVALDRKIDEAARQLDIPRRERLLDLPRRNGGVEMPVEREFGQPHRVVGRRDQPRSTHAFGQAETRRQRKTGGDPERKRNGKTGEQISPQPERAIYGSIAAGRRLGGTGARLWSLRLGEVGSHLAKLGRPF